MRKIGGHVSIAGGISNAIQNTINIGGNCMQIFAGSPRLWSRQLWKKEEVEKFTNLSKEKDLNPVFIHALYLVNLGTDKEDLLQKSIDSLILDIQNGDQIGAAGVVVHIGSHQGRGFDSIKNQIVESLQKIIFATSKTPILLETDAGQNGKIGSIEEIDFLIKAVNNPRVQICFDTAHLFEGGLDLREINQVNEFVKNLHNLNLIDKVSCVHLNDSATDLDSHKDNHADLGIGKIGLVGLSNFVNHQDLRHLPLILETPGKDKMGPDLENITIAKSL